MGSLSFSVVRDSPGGRKNDEERAVPSEIWNVLFSTGLTRSEFDEEARFLLAAKLYELGRLSSGQAAKLCGKGRVDFLLSLPRVGVSISNLRPEDAEVEMRFLEHG